VYSIYSYICVLPDGFLLKVIVFTVCEHVYMNMQPPPPPPPPNKVIEYPYSKFLTNIAAQKNDD
jgi:hypothetical protein